MSEQSPDKRERLIEAVRDFHAARRELPWNCAAMISAANELSEALAFYERTPSHALRKAAWVDGICKTCSENTRSCKCDHPDSPLLKNLFAAPQEGAGSSAGPATNGEPAAAAFPSTTPRSDLADIEDALWALHSYEAGRDDGGRVYSEIDITKMVSVIRALSPVSAIARSDLEDALNIGLAALGYFNTEQTDKHWNEQERVLRGIEARLRRSDGGKQTP